MNDEGVNYVKGSDGEEGWNGLFLYLTSIMPQPPKATEQPSQEWTRYLSAEKDALDADEICRAENANLGLSRLDAPLTRFEAQHAADLAELKVQWATVVTTGRSGQLS